MQVQISGKNVDVGDSLRRHITDRLEQNVAKYFDGSADGHVTVAREGSEFRVECTVHLSSGIVLQARGQTGDAYVGFDQAADRLEKRLRRYKRRLKDYHAKGNQRIPEFDASRYVIASAAEEGPEPADLNPVIIAEDTTRIQQLSVGEAVMQLDVSEAPFLFFRNVSHGGLNVVYRRDDGNLGWIDPVRTGNG
jgi:ribosomal subunit interface protein